MFNPTTLFWLPMEHVLTGRRNYRSLIGESQMDVPTINQPIMGPLKATVYVHKIFQAQMEERRK